MAANNIFRRQKSVVLPKQEDVDTASIHPRNKLQGTLEAFNRALIIHGWGGSPKRDWMPWAKQELEKKGYKVSVPEMPDTQNPKIEAWLEKLRQEIGQANENTILIGHSIGCQAILRYLATLPESRQFEKVILVAVWGNKLILDDDEEESIAKPWTDTPIDYETAKRRAKSFVAIFSDNDPYVPLEENERLYREELGAKIIVEKNQGHFNEDTLPVLIKLL